MAYDALMNGPMFLQCFYNHLQTSGQYEACTMFTPEFEDFLNHVAIWGQFQDSVRTCLKLSIHWKLLVVALQIVYVSISKYSTGRGQLPNLRIPKATLFICLLLLVN